MLMKGTQHDCDAQPDLESKEIEDAEFAKNIQDEIFKQLRRTHVTHLKKKLDRFKKHFNDRMNEVEDKIKSVE